MNINKIQLITSVLTNSNFVTLKIDIKLFDDGSKKGFANFNEYIRANVNKEFGVYVFFGPEKEIPIYIGMAGKLDKNSQPNQTLDERLTAARYKNKVTDKWIMTNQWVFEIMKENKIQELFIYVFYANPNIPAAYIEAILLFEFYKKYNIIPSQNSEF